MTHLEQDKLRWKFRTERKQGGSMDTCQRQLIPAASKIPLGEMTARSPAGTQPQAELKQHQQYVLWVCDSPRPGMDHQVRAYQQS